jgi:hypothetical protein
MRATELGCRLQESTDLRAVCEAHGGGNSAKSKGRYEGDDVLDWKSQVL